MGPEPSLEMQTYRYQHKNPPGDIFKRHKSGEPTEFCALIQSLQGAAQRASPESDRLLNSEISGIGICD